MRGWLRHLGKADPSHARARGFQSGQSKAADNIVATCLAMAAATSRNQRWRVGSTSASGRNGGSLRKSTIVALARKLLVALWKYVTAGVVIDGAVVRAA